MVLEVNKNSLIVQSNRLIEAKYRLSVEEQKIVKILISQIQREDDDFKNYEFRIKELAEMLEMNHKDPYGVLRTITKRLMTRALEFFNPETQTLLQASWLSSAEYQQGQGTVALCFDPKLKPLLLQLQSYFTKYEIGQVMQFKGQYTIRFFEFRKSFIGKNQKEVTFTLKELRETLGLNKEEYKQFFDFKKRVLEPARLELGEKTGKAFQWSVIRQGHGGKITGVRFVFDEDKKLKSREEKATETPSETPQEVPRAEILAHLVRCGLSQASAQACVRQYDDAYIAEKIALAEAHPEEVRNKPGFLLEALKNDWRSPEEAMRREQAAQQVQEQAHAAQQHKLRTLLEKYRAHCKNAGLQQYQRLTEEQRHQLKEAYLADLPAPLRERYQRQPEFGYEDGFFRSFFLGRLPDALPTLDQYLVSQAITLTDDERHALTALQNAL